MSNYYAGAEGWEEDVNVDVDVDDLKTRFDSAKDAFPKTIDNPCLISQTPGEEREKDKEHAKEFLITIMEELAQEIEDAMEKIGEGSPKYEDLKDLLKEVNEAATGNAPWIEEAMKDSN